jgi:hypothetical protein
VLGFGHLNVLIVSDDPKGVLFDQITGFRETIQKLDNDVDLLAFSESDIFFNDRIVKKRESNIRFLEATLRGKSYGLVAVSVGLDHAKKLFLEKPNILDFLKKYSPQTKAYVFGAFSILGQIEKDSGIQVFLYSRHGVAKLTREFKNDIVGLIKRK